MSVLEGFLRQGEACTQVSALRKSLDQRYSQWTFLVVFERQWFRDKRSNRLYAPAFQMLFASFSDDFANDLTTTLDNDLWFLLFYNLTHSCKEVLWESKGVDLISEILQTVPSGLHPTFFSVICVTIGDTHDKLDLFSERAFSHFKERLEGLFLHHSLQRVLIKRHHVETSGAGTKQVSDSQLPLFVENAIQWACRKTPEATDVSAPSQKGNAALLALFPKLNKLLYTSTFYESDESTCCGDMSGPVEGRKELLAFKLLEGRREAVNDLKRRVGNVASFTLPQLASFGETGQRWHVLLVQKLFEEKQEVSFENPDPGALEPQPIGAELHIIRDGGEVLYLRSRLCDEKSFDTVYGDMMHEDGELFVQLTPLEGIAFDDIDSYLRFISTEGRRLDVVTPTEPLCKGSCSGYTFPKVVFRRPTGAFVKDIVITSSHAEIVEESPRTPEEWEVARHALAFLSEHITPLSSVTAAGGYTLSGSVTPVPLPAHDDKCAVCGRRRDKLLRCGGCRVEMYCCKKHQMIDWKDGHKKMCGLWRRAQEEYDSRVVPHIQSLQAALPETFSASAVTTLLEFLLASRWDLQRWTVPVVHIIGVDSDVDGFLMELTRRVDEFHVHWKQLRLLLCSEAFKDEERNAVYAIHEGGNMSRTPPTVLLGDVWHTQSGGEDTIQAAMLVRLYNKKYHVLASDGAGVFNGGACAPSAVISFGSPSGTGMSYFTAAAEVLADRLVGVIPVMCTEPTLVSAHRTLDAIFLRVRSSSVMGDDLKKKVLARHSKPDDLIQLNFTGMGREALRSPSGAADGPPKTAGRSLPLISHPNLYFFTVPREC